MRAITSIIVCIFATLPALAQATGTKLTSSQIATISLPSVVSIIVRGKSGEVLRMGSGFVVKSGLVATNQHIVAGASSLNVTFNDGRSVPAPGFVKESTRYDIAIISCDTGSIRSLALGDSSNVIIGDDVVAIGSPEGLAGTISAGIVSAIRVLPDRGNPKVFQTTAPISHGSSGGPLLNTQGEVIGMNSFYIARAQNLNFAYASQYLKDIILACSPAKDVTSWQNVPSLLNLFATDRSVSSEAIVACIDKGADVNAHGDHGNTALMDVAYDGNTDGITELLLAGADVNAKNDNGLSAIMASATSGNIQSLDKLIEAGADVNDTNKEGATPLMIAVHEVKVACVKLLLAHAVDVNAVNLSGLTPLMIAAWAGNAESVQALITAGAHLNAKTDDGTTSLMVAAHYGNVDCLKSLIRAGANVNARLSDGFTALMYAAQAKNSTCVQALLGADARANVKDADGETPLHLAAMGGSAECIVSLISAGADVDAKTDEGTTPLMVAAYYGKVDSVKSLITAHANLNAKNNYGKSALVFAKSGDKGISNTDIAAILKAAGEVE